MGYCLRDSKDCPVPIEHILLFPCRHTAAFCIFTQENQKYFTVKDIFWKQPIGSHAFYMGHLYIIHEPYQ